ncbi:MAG: hypothetical protein EBS86_04495 [Crocinitomicaceae bacterium]|nr:hypothetical protein [Crocinitomicaceae bacterium]
MADEQVGFPPSGLVSNSPLQAGYEAPLDTPKKDKVMKLVLAGLGFAWATFGIVAFVFSLICFGYSGTILEKIVGVLLSIFAGPFYFIYYFASASYCKRMPPTIF